MYFPKPAMDNEKIIFPSYYQTASLDKRNLDIIESLIQNPRNKELSLFETLCSKEHEIKTTKEIYENVNNK